MKNRFLDVLIKFILFSAVLHITLLLIFFVISHDLTVVNYYQIIGLNLFFPQIGQGAVSQVLSILTMILFYGLIFVFARRKK